MASMRSPLRGGSSPYLQSFSPAKSLEKAICTSTSSGRMKRSSAPSIYDAEIPLGKSAYHSVSQADIVGNATLSLKMATAFILTWMYFVFVVWMFDHLAVANYVYKSLRINTLYLMLVLSAFGTLMGFSTAMMGLFMPTARRIWFVPAILNLLTLVLIVVSPKAVL